MRYDKTNPPNTPEIISSLDHDTAINALKLLYYVEERRKLDVEAQRQQHFFYSSSEVAAAIIEAKRRIAEGRELEK